jgi:hypothetical protein
VSTSLERASNVARFVELQSISLKAANLTTAVHPLQLPSSLEIQSRYRAAHDTSDSEYLLVVVDFEFEGRATDTDAETDAAIQLDATFTLVYKWKPEAAYPEGAEADFARLNGAYNVWPYWRELVQTVSGRVGLAGIVVPVFRAQDFEMRFKGITDQTEHAKKAAPKGKAVEA